jgi:hypothetical protein
MAEKTVISIEVDGVQKSINSIKELKAELKAAQSAALNGDGKAAKRVAELKDKMDDLKDTTKSLQGSGVEKISSSFSLLGQGLKDFDTDKITTGFKGVGAAMKAIPIFLLIEGISYLVENWKELSEGNGLVAKSLQFLGDIFTAITDKIYEFTDAIGLTNTELEKQGEAIKGFTEKSNEALQSQTAAFDRQIAVAKASGKGTVELEKQKQQAIIDTNYLIAKQIEAFVRAGGALDDEKKKQLTASLEFIKNAKVQEYVITENDNKAKQEQYKKYLEKLGEIRRQNDIDQKLIDEQVAKNKAKDQKAIDDEANKYSKQSALDNAEIKGGELQGLDDKFRQIDKEKKAKWDAEDIEEGIRKLGEVIKNTESVLAQTQVLSDLFFAQKLSKAQKGSAEETAIAKKQFEVNKGLQIANATMQGAQAVLAAYASGSAIPIIGAVAGPLYAVAAGLVAIKNIQQIKATQFGGGTPTVNAGSTSAPSLPSGNGVPSIAPPTQNTTTFTGNNNNNFNNQPIKTYVVETDLRNSTNTIDRIKEQSTF